MRYTLLIGLLLGSATLATAQPQTLLSRSFHNGGFGGPVLQIGTIKDSPGVFIGGRGGWIIGHKLIVGMGGYALINDINVPNEPNRKLAFEYGGFEMEYVLASDRMLHLSVYGLIGSGGLHHRMDWDESQEDVNWVNDRVLVLQPALNATINVTGFFRISLGGSYRYVSGVDLDGFSDADLTGPAANLTLRFGAF